MVLLDLLGRRWMLRVLWELREGEAVPFNELQRRCGAIVPSVLAQRLRDLGDAGLVEALPDGRYRCPPATRGLQEPLLALDRWAQGWARRSRRSRRSA